MKIEKGKISILIGCDSTTIEIQDGKSNTRFVKITLTPEQLSAALSRQMSIECEVEVYGLDKVGKTHECKDFVFEITRELVASRYSSDSNEKLREVAQGLLKDGWIADGYFGSQNSFFTKDGKEFARCTIRKWI